MVDQAPGKRQTSSAPVSSRSVSRQSTTGAAGLPIPRAFGGFTGGAPPWVVFVGSTGGGGVPMIDRASARLASACPDMSPVLPTPVVPTGQTDDGSLRAAWFPAEWRPAELLTPASPARESLVSRPVAVSSDCSAAASPCRPQSGFVRSGSVQSWPAKSRVVQSRRGQAESVQPESAQFRVAVGRFGLEMPGGVILGIAAAATSCGSAELAAATGAAAGG